MGIERAKGKSMEIQFQKMAKRKELRKISTNFLISVDGRVNNKTGASYALEYADADVLVAGSYTNSNDQNSPWRLTKSLNNILIKWIWMNQSFKK